jgi:CubicO group peptidase (beta-lactamase class C family)
MKFFPLAKVAACLTALFLSTNLRAAERPSFDLDVHNYLQPLLSTNNFSGVILVANGDKIVFQRGYGFASIENKVPNRPETVFQLASISKSFTAAAILLLAEQGRININAPLKDILPHYPHGEKLTIHHLLTHTSGIPNINDFPEYDDLQLKPQTPKQLVAHFQDKPLEFDPGKRYSYSNSNYNLLALIIEAASGTDYGSFLRSAILDPLKLKQAGHHGSAEEIINGLANGYAPHGNLGLKRAAYLDWSVKTGNGSLYSDAEGVMRFIRAVHQGHLLAPASVAATFTAHTPNVGYGWFLAEANRRQIHHINGRSPGWAAQADYYVKEGITIVVLANSYISVTTEIARAVGAIYFGEPVKPMPALRPDPLEEKLAAGLKGKYQFGPDYFVPHALISIRFNDGHLEAMVGDYGPYALVQISPTRFLLRSFWVPAEFRLGANGEAKELIIDGRKGLRVR